MDSQFRMNIEKLIKVENYPIHLGSQVWIHIPLKVEFLLKLKERCKPIKTWLHVF